MKKEAKNMVKFYYHGVTTNLPQQKTPNEPFNFIPFASVVQGADNHKTATEAL